MSGDFADGEFLSNASPSLLAMPFTVGALVNLRAVGSVRRSIFALSDTGTTTNYLQLAMSSGETLQINGNAGTLRQASLATAIAAGAWAFVIGRFIASNNRRIAALYQSGLIEHNNSTLAAGPTGLDRLTIGGCEGSAGLIDSSWNGFIAELWYTNTDIQADGTQINEDIVRQLAWGGPFSVPHVGTAVQEYRSMRVSPASNEDRGREVYWANGGGIQTWTNTGPVSTGPHPPLPYWYVKPRQTKPILLV